MASKPKRSRERSLTPPETAQTLYERAEAARRHHQLGEASRYYRQALVRDAHFALAHYGLGATLALQQQWQAAAASFEAALQLHPDLAEASFDLAGVYRRLGAPGRAVDAYYRTLAIRQDYPGALQALADLLLQLGDWRRALGCYRQLLEREPGHAGAHLGLGVIHQQQGQLAQARTHYLQAVEQQPDLAAALANLGLLCKIEDRPAEAIDWYRRALVHEPDNPTILSNLAAVLEEVGDLQQAERLYERALSVQPEDIEALAGRASVREKRRDYQGAYDLLAPLARVRSDSVRLAIAFATACERQSRPAEALEVLIRTLERSQVPQDRVLLLFKLAGVQDTLGHYDEAFGCLEEAHALQPFFFDPVAWTGQIDALIATFSAENLANLPRSSNRSSVPVFIVGMPRSGTSLIEQILSRHSAIFAAGERGALFELAGTIDGYPARLESLKTEHLDALAEPYLAQLQQLAPAASRITDKLPQNYLHLGLIARLFPAARIIHCRRDPLDTCLSCYFQNFAARHPYTSRLEHLGQYYRQYERLMAHWREVLALPMLEVWYEELVAQQERVSRRLVEFLELQWEEECLSFWRSERLVNTASYDQVRRPLYDRSVGRARHYPAFVEKLKL
ncbi:tetratricopeptide repeat-containing sulfotransferase family protein [Gloeobacter kilaueensis]|uniref:Sulfotransferase n=1 Tax=Gloeobacter kilaueensis (strain ATCC BAA-2537 / CCAP 1431/1 / ULC 316 / JS1) TaxID=1183438 RepID=U5QHF0_GLOK1|nr:sulfotransferase [Gloeobacter kilaueensis]AGY57064.1 sulfotransferase [Gloeobacter kilaueensis JS1]